MKEEIEGTAITRILVLIDRNIPCARECDLQRGRGRVCVS